MTAATLFSDIPYDYENTRKSMSFFLIPQSIERKVITFIPQNRFCLNSVLYTHPTLNGMHPL
jgi:hypothetical protein